MTSVLSADSMLAAVLAPLPPASASAPAPATSAAPVPPTPAAVPAPIPTASSSSTNPTPAPPARSKPNKVHVPSACINCKKAHLACDISRPCKRCISVGKHETCRDVEHKKRGRPKLVDKQVEIDTSAWGPQGKEPILSTAAALPKNRAKGKYTKSANYKASRRAPSTASSAPSSNGATMIGAAGPHNPIHTPSTATPSPDTTSSRIHHDASAPSPPSYLDRARHAQYPHQDYSHHHHSTSYASRPLESPAREEKDPFFAAQNHYRPTSQPLSAGGAPQSPVVTLFLSMELYCARVSDESQTMWGYHPHDISNKSLHSIISPEDQGKLGHLQHLLKDALFAAVSPADPRHLSQFPFLESTSPVFYQNRPGIMSSIAPGASEVNDVVRVRYANGGSDLFTIRLYIGGGLGTDLVRCMNVEHAYIVCVMTRYVDHHRQEHHQHQPQHHHHAHHVSPRSSLDEPERIPPPPMRTTSQPNSRPASLYLDEHSAPYPSDGGYSDSNGNRMSSSRISLPSLPNVFTGPTAPLPSPSAYSSRRGSMSLGSPLTPNPGSLPPATSEAPSSSSSLATLSRTASSSTTSLHATQRPSSTSGPFPLSAPLPSLRAEPLHKARWLYEPEALGGARNTPSSMLQGGSGGYGSGPSSSGMGGSDGYQQHSSHHHGSSQGRLPSLLSDPFGAFSAPMGGFGVSKYLSRPEPTPSFAPTGRHMLPLPGSLSQRAPGASSSSSSQPLTSSTRTLQRDLSSSVYGATFGAQPPPAISMALKRPLADVSDNQDRVCDMHSRHHDPVQLHGNNSSSSSSSAASSSIKPTAAAPASSTSSPLLSASSAVEPTGRVVALDLQTMPPDHPPVDVSKGAVCPIVHGERMKQQATHHTTAPAPPTHAYTTSRPASMHEANGISDMAPPPCPWAKETQAWSSKMHPLEATAAAATDEPRRRSLEDHLHEGGNGANGSIRNGGGSATPYSGSPPPSPHHHPYRPTSSTYTYPSQSHHRRSGSISRQGGSGLANNAVRHSSLGGPSHHPHCLSGACSVVCRCHVEDDETRAAKAMEAARKRMSVHSLLC